MFGAYAQNSRFAKVLQRHLEGLRIIVGFVACTFGAVAVDKAFSASPRSSTRFLDFTLVTVALVALLALFYLLMSQK